MNDNDSQRSDDEALARRMIQAVVWMKRQYQDAGMIVAHVFCEAKNIDADAIERDVRSGKGVE